MLYNKDYGDGVKSNANRSQGKQDHFCAPTSVLEDVVFQTHSPAAHFNKSNYRLADHIRVTFKQMGPTMGKAMRKLVKPFIVVPSIPDSNSKFYDAKIIVFSETYKIANQDIREFKDVNQRSYNLYKQHCAEAMMQKLKTLPNWKIIK